MTAAGSLFLRVFAVIALTAALMLPTLAGAMSAPAASQTEAAGADACPDELDMERGASSPEPQSVSVCLELMPDETEPEDGTQSPSVQETRAMTGHRRAETT